MRRTLPVLTLACLLLVPTAGLAQNRVEQQMFAELRMLQEQMKQLQLSVNAAADQSKALAAKQEEQANTTRKAFADSKVLTDSIIDSIRILREKGDDTNVRIATVATELQAMVQAIQALQTSVLQAMATAAAAPAGAPADAGTTQTGAPSTQAPGAAPVQSPKQVFQQAYGDYAANHFDLAIAGFKGYLASFPTSPDAYQAQFQIGESYFAQGKFNLAAQAYREMIDTYKNVPLLPDAYYKRGLSYLELAGMKDQARADFQLVISKFPDNNLAPLAKAKLESIK